MIVVVGAGVEEGRGGKRRRKNTPATKHTFIFGVTHVKEEGAAVAAATVAAATVAAVASTSL